MFVEKVGHGPKCKSHTWMLGLPSSRLLVLLAPFAQVRLKPGREHSAPIPNGYAMEMPSHRSGQLLRLVFTETAVGHGGASSPSTSVDLAMLIFGEFISVLYN